MVLQSSFALGAGKLLSKKAATVVAAFEVAGHTLLLLSVQYSTVLVVLFALSGGVVGAVISHYYQPLLSVSGFPFLSFLPPPCLSASVSLPR